MIIQKLQQFSKKLFTAETSVKKLTLSTCMGIFIAFSPFIGLHTLMAMAFCWIFSLNYPITLSVQLAINNPWTMVPVYGCGYGFGRLISGMCHVDFSQCMPSLFLRIFEPICSCVGMSTDFIWTFFVGGKALSVLLAIGMYVPIKWIFEKLEQRKQSIPS